MRQAKLDSRVSRSREGGYVLIWGMSAILGIAAMGGLLLHNYFGNRSASEALLQARIFAAAGYHNSTAPKDAALNLMALTARLNGYEDATPQAINRGLAKGNATLAFSPAADSRKVSASVSFEAGVLEGWMGYSTHTVSQQATAEIPLANAVVNIDLSASLNVSSQATAVLAGFGMAEPMTTPPPNALAVRLPYLFGMGPAPKSGEPGPAWTRYWNLAPSRHVTNLPACAWETQYAGQEGGAICDGGDIAQSHAMSIFMSDLFQKHYKDSVNTMLATIAFSFRDIFVNTFAGKLSDGQRAALRNYGEESMKRLGLPEQSIEIPAGDDSAVFTLWNPLDPENTSHSYVYSQLPKNNLLYNLLGCFEHAAYFSLIKYANIETSEDNGSTFEERYPPGHFASIFSPIRHPLTPNNLGNAFPSERWDSDPYSADLGYFPLCVTPLVGGGKVYPSNAELPTNVQKINREELNNLREPTGNMVPIARVSFPKEEAPDGTPYIWDAVQALAISRGVGTNTPAAMHRAWQQFNALAAGASDSHIRQNIIFLITDGIPSDPNGDTHADMMYRLRGEIELLKRDHGATIVTILLKQPSLRTIWKENVRRAIEAVWGSLSAVPGTVPPNIRALWNEHIVPMTPIVSTSNACTSYALNDECCSGGSDGGAGGFCAFWNHMLEEATKDDTVANSFKSMMQAERDIFIEVPLDDDNFAPETFLLPSMAALAQLATPAPEFSR